MSYLVWPFKGCSQVGQELPFPLLQQVQHMLALVGKKEIIKGAIKGALLQTQAFEELTEKSRL